VQQSSAPVARLGSDINNSCSAGAETIVYDRGLLLLAGLV